MTLEKYLQINYSPTSIKGYINMIKRFKLAFERNFEKQGIEANQATYTDILNYIGTLRKENLHPKSLRNNLFAIKIYFNYLVEIGKRNDHPCKYLHLKDQINRQIQIENLYTKEQLAQLYKNYETQKSKKSENERRDKIIISLLIYQALTVLEITKLQKEDINLEEGLITIKANTKNKERTLNLKPNQILLFHNYLQNDWKRYHQLKQTNHFLMNKYGLPLWQGSINRLINKGKEKNERLRPLKIRQSVIAHLLKEGKDIRVVQAFAGHRRTASTEAYQQTGLEQLQSAINKYHPLQ